MTSSPALPGLAPGRQPYGAPGAGRWLPTVPHVLIVGNRSATYVSAPITRGAALYDTQTTVRYRDEAGEWTKQQHLVYCLPNEQAWADVQAAHADLTARLVELADELRRLGRYDARLEEAGGLKQAPNPLTPTAIFAEDPESRSLFSWGDPWKITVIERQTLARHTAKMLFYRYAAAKDAESSPSAQHGYVVCPTDADWKRVKALHTAADQARRALEKLLKTDLGTYDDPRFEKRYGPATFPVTQGEEKALAVVENTVVESYLVMTPDEARRAADAIKVAVEDLRVKIDEFDQARGWKALGYESFRAWAIAEIPEASIRHVYRLRDAAEVDRSLGVTIGHTPEAHARELKHVPAEQRPDVLKQADERAASQGRERTAADVRQAAAVTNGHTPDALARVAEELRRGDTKAAYAAARLAGEHYGRAMAAVDARVEGKPLDQALAILAGRPAETPARAEMITVKTRDGDREAPVLKRSGVLALAPAWYVPKDRALPVLSDEHWTVTHVPTGYMIGRLITSWPEAERLFDQVAALDWSQVPADGKMPTDMGEEIARVFGLPFPPGEALSRAQARAKVHRLHLIVGVSNDAQQVRSYVLCDWHDPRERRETFARWSQVLARLDELERPAPPAPPKQILVGRLGELEDRIAAGATLSTDAALVEELRAAVPTELAYVPPNIVASVERRLRAAEEALAVPPVDEADAVPDDERPAYTAAERALADELAACSPRLRRLLLCAVATPDEVPESEDRDGLFDILTEGLLMTVDEALVWALEAEGAPVESREAAI